MKNLNMFCPINTTGYGITSKNITIELNKLFNVSLFPIGSHVNIDTEQEKTILSKCLSNSNTYDPTAPCIKIWHQHELASRIGTGNYYVLPFFEADKLQDREIHQINCADHVFTASKWGKETLEKNNITKPISVTPLGVNLDIFQQPQKIRIDNGKYVFFHIGKWEKRKGQDVLIEAFNRAFEKTDNVELRLLPQNPFLTKEEEEAWHSLIKNSKLSDKINAYNRLPTHYHLAQFIFEADCGVFMSRAEGWNNEIPEVMAMNKPVIATNYSAHTEYCNKENSFLIDISETEPAIDNKWFFGHGNWAKIGEEQIEQTIEYMRYVYKNNIKTNSHGLETAQQLSWKNTASIISNILTSNKKSDNANTTKKRGRKPKKVSS